MTPDQTQEPRSSAQGTNTRESDLDPLEDVSLDGLDLDERLQSGVPEAQRASDLDFIQMTGLGRPVLSQEDPIAPPSVEPSELDARRPLSFFEKGVADVDASMAPPALDAEDSFAEEIVPSFGPAREEPPPTVILPEPPPAPSEYSSEPARPTPLASVFDFDDLDTGATPRPETIRDSLETPRESSPPASASSPQDDLAELSQAVDRLKATPKPSPLPAPPPTEAADDDWDEPKSTEPALGAWDLAEAEQLLQELEHQPRDMASPPSDKTATPKGEHVNNDGDDDESVYRQPQPTRRHRSGRGHTRQSRRILRWIPRVAALILVIFGGYVAYHQVMQLIEKPTASLERARQLKAAGRFDDASEGFARFAATQRDQPGRADAVFQAAYCLQLAPVQSFDETQAHKKQALQLFEQFVTDNPGHAKVARAKTRMGILHFDLEEYKEAIELLQNPSLQLADPESALPALRTLARARWKMGDYDAAESAFLQAAALANNYTPDLDYEELGSLNRWRAENAQENDAARQRYRAAAVENWTRAMRVSGIDPATKAKIRTKCAWFLSQAQGQPPEGGGKPPAAAPGDAPKPGDTAQSVAPAVAPVEQTPKGPDPRIEAQYPGTPPASEASQTPAPPSEDGKDEHAASSHS